jgi:hypothetical protein
VTRFKHPPLFVQGFARACQPEQRSRSAQRKDLPEVELYKPPLRSSPAESANTLPPNVVLPDLYCPFHGMYIHDPSRHICPRESLIKVAPKKAKQPSEFRKDWAPPYGRAWTPTPESRLDPNGDGFERYRT